MGWFWGKSYPSGMITGGSLLDPASTSQPRCSSRSIRRRVSRDSASLAARSLSKSLASWSQSPTCWTCCGFHVDSTVLQCYSWETSRTSTTLKVIHRQDLFTFALDCKTMQNISLKHVLESICAEYRWITKWNDMKCLQYCMRLYAYLLHRIPV